MLAFYKARRRGLYTRVRYSNDKYIYAQRELEKEKKKSRTNVQPEALLPATARMGTLMRSTCVRDEEENLGRTQLPLFYAYQIHSRTQLLYLKGVPIAEW